METFIHYEGLHYEPLKLYYVVKILPNIAQRLGIAPLGQLLRLPH
jgi:hypothetical protein